ILDLVRQCYAELRDGTLQFASGKTEVSVSRRKWSDEGLQWAPAYDALIDRELFVIKLLDANGYIQGILLNHGCHPTTVGSNNYLISAEFVGHACSILEAKYPNCIAMFLQGCAGEVKPM